MTGEYTHLTYIPGNIPWHTRLSRFLTLFCNCAIHHVAPVTKVYPASIYLSLSHPSLTHTLFLSPTLCCSSNLRETYWLTYFFRFQEYPAFWRRMIWLFILCPKNRLQAVMEGFFRWNLIWNNKIFQRINKYSTSVIFFGHSKLSEAFDDFFDGLPNIEGYRSFVGEIKM